MSGARFLGVSFWSPIGKGRWTAGATVPATTARTTHREAAARQVRELRRQGVAAFASPYTKPHLDLGGPPQARHFDPNSDEILGE